MQISMKLFHAYVAGKYKLDRIDFFLAERRPNDDLRRILHYLGLGQIRQRIRDGQLELSEAERLCIIASKLLKESEVEALQQYVINGMGIGPSNFYVKEIEPPLDKSALADIGLQLALQAYHDDGLFLALWGNATYDLPVKIGGFVVQEAQSILEARADQLDSQFTRFVQQSDTLDDLLGADTQ